MKYNFYQRKDTNISQNELDWINKNLDKISLKENVLFIFQAEHEALVITNRGIYFPNRKSLIKIEFNQINKIKIGGDFHIEITLHIFEKYTIVFVSPIDKVKMNNVLNLLVKNNREKINTLFNDVEKIIDKITIIKSPQNQDQHKLPQVYLKEFGYLKKEQWMVSIINKGETFSRQKSIGSFTAETNVFDIESEDDRFPRMFESLNGDLENLYHEMLQDIEDNNTIPDKCWEIIVQLTPNIMVRSDYWRNFVKEILESEHKTSFLDITVSPLITSLEELKKLKEKEFYKVISEGALTRSKLNRVLILLLNYIFHHLRPLTLIILEAAEGKEFFTSDCPVNFKPNQEDEKPGLFSKNTEVYFPLSPKYLAYFYFEDGDNSNSKLRKLKNRGVYKVLDVMTEEEYFDLIQNETIKVSDEFLIVPRKFVYKK